MSFFDTFKKKIIPEEEEKKSFLGNFNKPSEKTGISFLDNDSFGFKSKPITESLKLGNPFEDYINTKLIEKKKQEIETPLVQNEFGVLAGQELTQTPKKSIFSRVLNTITSPFRDDMKSVAEDQAYGIMKEYLNPENDPKKVQLEDIRANPKIFTTAFWEKDSATDKAAERELNALIKQHEEFGLLPKTFTSTFKETPAYEYLPFAGSAVDIVQGKELYDAVKRFEKGVSTSRDELLMYKAATEAQRDKTFGAMIAEQLVNMPSFMAEFAATGGIATVGKTATKKAIKKYVENYLGKEFKETLGVKILAGIAGGTVQTPFVAATRIPAGTIERMIPEYSFKTDEDKNVLFNIESQGDGVFEAALKSFGDSWVETVSERSGDLFKYGGNAVKDSLIKAGLLKSFLKANPGATPAKFMQIIKKTGWDGVFEEMGEERLGEIGRAVLGIEKYKLPSLEQLAVELISFSVPGMAYSVADKTVELYDSMTPGERQAGFVRIPGEEDNKKKAEGIINSQTELDSLISQKAELESKGAPQDTLDRLQSQIDGIQSQFTPTENILKHKESAEEFRIIERGTNTSQVESLKTGEILNVPNDVLKNKFSIFKKQTTTQPLRKTADTMPTGAPDTMLPTFTPDGQLDKVVDTEKKELLYDSEGASQLTVGGTGPVSPAKVKEFKAFRQGLLGVKDKILTTVFDDYNAIKRMYAQDKNTPSEKRADILRYQMGGKITAMQENIVKAADSIIENRMQTAKKIGIDEAKFIDEIDNYMIAVHTPERNEALGDGASGMTNAKAEKIRNTTELKEYFGEIKRIADDIWNLNRETLKILEASGAEWRVLSDELKETLNKKYKHHIPLNRVMTEEEALESDKVQSASDILNTKGIGVKGTGIKKARGSEREVRDILSNIVVNGLYFADKVEKNRVAYTLYKSLEEHPEWEIAKLRGGIPTGKNFDGSIAFKREGMNVVPVMVDGKQMMMEFYDRDLGMIINEANKFNPGPLKPLVDAYKTVSDLWGASVTKFNYKFQLLNPIRDVLNAFSIVQGEMGIGKAARFTLKALSPKVRNSIIKYRRGIKDADSALYRKFLESGGYVSSGGPLSRGKIEDNIEKIAETHRSNTKKTLKNIVEVINTTSEMLENGTRFSAWLTAKEAGKSDVEAADLALRSTGNFNQGGSARSILGLLYKFANPSIQSAVETTKNYIKHPTTLVTKVLFYAMVGYLINMWNDAVDPDWRKKLPKGTRGYSFGIVIPSFDGGDPYILNWSIPYSDRFMKVTMDAATDLASGENVDFKQASEDILSAMIDGYNPLGGNGLIASLTPTLMRPIYEVMRNETWYGSAIKPAFSESTEESERYYDSLKESRSGRFFIHLTKGLSDIGIEVSPADLNYLAKQYLGGPGQVAGDVANIAEAVATGEMLPVEEIPGVNAFIKKVDPEWEDKYDYSEANKLIKEGKTESATSDTVRKREVKNAIEDMELDEKIIEKAKKDPKKLDALIEKQKEALKIISKDEVYFKEYEKQMKEKSKGFSQLDKNIKSLEVEDGSQARQLVKIWKKKHGKDSYTEMVNEAQDLFTREVISEKGLQKIILQINQELQAEIQKIQK